MEARRARREAVLQRKRERDEQRRQRELDAASQEPEEGENPANQQADSSDAVPEASQVVATQEDSWAEAEAQPGWADPRDEDSDARVGLSEKGNSRASLGHISSLQHSEAARHSNVAQQQGTHLDPKASAQKQRARSTVVPQQQQKTAELGHETKLASLRQDILALLTDGHRIQQEQAVRLTQLLRKSLEASGHAQKLEVSSAARLHHRIALEKGRMQQQRHRQQQGGVRWFNNGGTEADMNQPVFEVGPEP